MCLTKVMKKHNRAFEKASQIVEERRTEWSDFMKRAKQVFEQVIELHKHYKQFYDLLYIDNDYENGTEKKENHGYIALRFGKHPIGLEKVQINIEDGMVISSSTIVEVGGALYFGQAPNGKVLCLLYGCESEVKKNPKGKEFYFRLHHSPSRLSKRRIIKHIDNFMWYTRVTSSMGSFKIHDRIKYKYYMIRSNIIQHNWWKVISQIALVITITSGIVVIIVA